MTDHSKPESKILWKQGQIYHLSHITWETYLDMKWNIMFSQHYLLKG